MNFPPDTEISSIRHQTTEHDGTRDPLLHHESLVDVVHRTRATGKSGFGHVRALPCGLGATQEGWGGGCEAEGGGSGGGGEVGEGGLTCDGESRSGVLLNFHVNLLPAVAQEILSAAILLV